jgi:cytochrome b6-f complex iron-sulfur subunit
MKRRDFIRNSLSAGIILAIPLLSASCEKEEDPTNGGNGGLPPQNEDIQIDLNSPLYSALASAGGFVLINGIIVANTGSGFVALSSICTHQGCTITYSSSNNNFPCPCHGSVFSTTGSVINGPAATPVKRYTVTKEDNILTISE